MNLQVPAYKHHFCEHSAVAYGSVHTKEHTHNLFIHSQIVLNVEAEHLFWKQVSIRLFVKAHSTSSCLSPFIIFLLYSSHSYNGLKANIYEPH